MTDEEMIADAMRADGSEVLPTVILGRHRADALLLKLATRFSEVVKERDATVALLAKLGDEVRLLARAEAAEQLVATLEAKVTKLVEALRWQAEQPEAHPFMAQHARAALAEIEGDQK